MEPSIFACQMGWLGIRSVVSLAPSAYLASAASTKELTASLLPTHLRELTDSGIASATSAWIQWASSKSADSSPVTSPIPPDSSVQRIWDNRCCEVQADQLLQTAVHDVERARLLASRSPGSGDWLDAMPLSSIGLKLDNASVRIAIGLRLGAPIVHLHKCICGTTVTTEGHHGLSCRRGSGRHSRHNQVNEILCRAFNSIGAFATREPHSVCGRSDKRPDGVTQIPWRRGRCLAWDATCPNTFAQSYVQTTSRTAGSAAAGAELKKQQKYNDLNVGIDFVPFAIETSGVWGEEAMRLVTEIGRRTSFITHEPRSTAFLRQRISLAVQRGNSACINGTLAVQCR